jgi:hypothetical protein
MVMFISKQDFGINKVFNLPGGGKYEMCKLELPVIDGPDVSINTEEKTNRELKRIHGECVKKYGSIIIDWENDKNIIVEEDDGYCD